MYLCYYPIPGAERNYPFFVEGIGIQEHQYHMTRSYDYPYYQLFFCTEGEGVVLYHGKEYVVYPNSVFLLPGNDKHEYYPTTDKWTIYWLSFGGFAIDSTLREMNLSTFEVYYNVDLSPIQDKFHAIYQVLSSDPIYGGSLASAALYDYIMEFNRIAHNIIPLSSAKTQGQILPAIDYISLHFRSNITLAQLALETNMSEQHLCRCFKKHLAFRPMEYVTQRRIQVAKVLLLYTKRTIEDIAEEIGFRDGNYFSTVFRKYEQISPSLYRKKGI